MNKKKKKKKKGGPLPAGSPRPVLWLSVAQGTSLLATLALMVATQPSSTAAVHRS